MRCLFSILFGAGVVLFTTGSSGKSAALHYRRTFLLQSLICAIIFTGLGFSLVGEFSRAGLYSIVLLIWLFQLLFSRWWLHRFKLGPVEWLWRSLTYGRLPQ